MMEHFLQPIRTLALKAIVLASIVCGVSALTPHDLAYALETSMTAAEKADLERRLWAFEKRRQTECRYNALCVEIVAGGTGHLILVSQPSTSPLEEPAEISRPQAEALLELTAGQTEYLSIPIDIGSHSATIQRFVTPTPLDLISIAFRQDKMARKFQPPVWFGPEVTSEPTYQVRSLALTGLPSTPEVEVTDAALHSLLDALGDRAGEPQPQPSWVAPEPETSEPILDPEAERELNGLNIEDSVIGELARSLQPQGR